MFSLNWGFYRRSSLSAFLWLQSSFTDTLRIARRKRGFVWSSGFRLISRWLWLWLRSTRKRWDCRSFSLSGYFAFIPVRKPQRFLLFSMFLCLSWLLLGTDKVAAQTQCDDPETPIHEMCTPTWEPLFPSSTPMPTTDFTCPTLQPSGWGTVTPDPAWFIGCGQCIQRSTAVWPSTPTPSSCYAGTATAAVGGPTATVVPGASGWCASCPADNNCSGLATGTPTPTITPTIGPAYYLEHLGTSTVIRSNEVVPYPNWEYYYGNVITIPGRSSVYRAVFWSQTFTGQVDGGAFNAAGTYQYNSNWSPSQAVKWSAVTNADTTANQIIQDLSWVDPLTISNTISYWPNELKAGVRMGNGGTYSGSTVLDVWLVKYGVPPDPSTPTPTVTPTGFPGYCGSVVPAGTPGPGVELPMPRVGTATCTQVGGYTIGLSWVASIGELVGVTVPESITMPGVNICWAPIEFGVLSMFGVNIDLDWIAFIVAGIAALRLLWRS